MEAALPASPVAVYPPIAPPLRPWLVWLLVISTLTAYVPFWLARTARDARSLGLAERSPPLWFIGSLFGLPLLWLFPRIHDDWEGVVHARTAFQRAAPLFGVIAFVAVTLSRSAERFLPMSDHTHWWIVLAILGVYGIPFAFAQAYVNRFKDSIPVERLSRAPYRLSVLHWLAMAAGSAFLVVASVGYVMDEMIRSDGLALAPGEVYESPDRTYSLRVAGGGWWVVPVGSFSDGTAELELRGDGVNTFVIVFSYDNSQSLQSLAAERFDAGLAEGYKCVEERVLDQQTMKVRIDIACEDTLLNNPEMAFFTIVESTSGVLEASGYTSDTKANFERLADAVRTTTRSLKEIGP